MQHRLRSRSFSCSLCSFPGQEHFSLIESDAVVNALPKYVESFVPRDQETIEDQIAARREALARIGELQVSPSAAFPWFLKAAEYGDPRAQNNLGIFYSEYCGDQSLAISWFEKAAAQGLAAAQNHLAVIYNEEFGY